MLIAQSPKVVSINALNYRYSISVNSAIDQNRNLVVSGCVTFQRCAIDANGLYTDDPTPGSCQTVGIGNLSEFATANPTLAPLIQTAWSELDAFADALNALQKLV